VVDDDIFIAWIIQGIVERAGFENVRAYDDPAVALCEATRSAPPALVVTDFDMPGMNGVELLSRIEKQHPGIKGIIISGNAENIRSIQNKHQVLAKDGTLEERLKASINDLQLQRKP
jgi:DNA-binding NtrC family response regulator